jgi:hypothetical protein
MTQNIILLPDSGTGAPGDQLKIAFGKTNANFNVAFAHFSNTSNPHNVTAAQTGAIPETARGVPAGVATLDLTGRVPSSQAPPLSIIGDATATGSATLTLTLANTGVSPGTYRSVVVDAKGRVVAGASENATPVFTAGTYAFVDSSAYVTAEDAVVRISAAALALPVDDTASTQMPVEGAFRFNSDLGRIEYANGSRWIDPASEYRAGQNRLFVSKDGNDMFAGLSPGSPFRTIAAACAAAGAKTASGDFEAGRVTIFVASGDYTEQCPISVPDGVSIIGDNLRSVTVRPATSETNIFLLGSGCYVWGLTTRGHRLYPSALDITPEGYVGYNGRGMPLSTSQVGWAFSFRPGATIRISPYVQNCSSISGSGIYGSVGYAPGGGGLLCDPSVLNPASPIKSIVIDAFTQVNLGGIGVKVVGQGYVQLVSFFKNFCQFGVLCVNGGHASLLNSNCSFGNYALWSHGSRVLSDASDFGSLIEASGYTMSYAGAGIDYSKLPSSQGGHGEADPGKYTILTGDNPKLPRIYSTITDEGGDFYVGRIASEGGGSPRPTFRISQTKGSIDGRAFHQSIFGFMAPFILALTRKG